MARVPIIILLISVVALILALSVKNQSISSIIRRIDPDVWQGETAVFMICQVDTCCRPVGRLKEVLANKKIVLFLFHHDFSDEDIENFREAFKIPQEALTERMNDRWEKVFSKLQQNQKNKNMVLNYYIDISKGRIKAVEFF